MAGKNRTSTGQFTPGTSGNPKGRPTKRVQRRDGWSNSASGHGTYRDRRVLTRYGVDIVTDLEAMQLWRSEWLAAKIIELQPQEIFRRGYELKSDKAKPEQLAKVLTRAQELELDKRMVLAEMYRRAYGGAAIFGVLDGALDRLEQPLDENRITAVRAYHVLEPRELWPMTYYDDIASPKFGRPETYQLQPLTTGRAQAAISGKVVHESRLAILLGPRVSRLTQPGQRESWGDTELSRRRQILADLGVSWGSVATILAELGHGVLEMAGLAQLLADEQDGMVALKRRLDAIDLGKSTLHTLVIDGADKYSRANIPLAGASDLLEQLSLLASAASGYPVSVLFGMIKGGLNASGDSDVRNWYAHVDAFRNAETKPALEQCLRWIMRSTTGPLGGREPEVWSVQFRPLWQPSEKEQAETRKLDAETDDVNIRNGVYSSDDAAKSHYGGDEYRSGITIDWDAREEQQRVEEERATEIEANAADLAALGRDQQRAGDVVDPAKPDSNAASET